MRKLIAAALLVPSAPASAKIQIGISEQNPNVFENTYFKALQMGPANRVAPVDKLSLPLTIP